MPKDQLSLFDIAPVVIDDKLIAKLCTIACTMRAPVEDLRYEHFQAVLTLQALAAIIKEHGIQPQFEIKLTRGAGLGV